MVILIESGCAECGPYELNGEEVLLERHEFATIEAAKEWVSGLGWLAGRSWKPHPQGGEHIVTGQGSVWILS